jgi:dCTP diphosphatase
VRIADRCNVDLASAVKDKMEKNARKYPADLCKGKSDKYHAYEDAVANASSQDPASASNEAQEAAQVLEQ